jgi:hypothetical protein
MSEINDTPTDPAATPPELSPQPSHDNLTAEPLELSAESSPANAVSISPQPSPDNPTAAATRFPLPYSPARRITSRVFAVLGALALLLSLTASWVHNTVMNTDDYIAAVSDLPSQPAVAHLIATNITDTLIEQGVPALQDQVHDDVIKAAVPFAAQALRPQLIKIVETGVRSPQFRTVWIMANKEAHSLLIRVLQGDTIAGVQTSGNEIVVNVGNIADTLLPSLGGSKLGKELLKVAKNGEIRIQTPNQILQARAQLRLANQYYALLVSLTIVLLALALLISDRPRRMAERMGWSIAGACLAFIVIVRIALSTGVGSITDPDMAAAAKEVANAVTGSLVHRSIMAMLVSALVAAFARFIGRAYPQIP